METTVSLTELRKFLNEDFAKLLETSKKPEPPAPQPVKAAQGGTPQNSGSPAPRVTLLGTLVDLKQAEDGSWQLPASMATLPGVSALDKFDDFKLPLLKWNVGPILSGGVGIGVGVLANKVVDAVVPETAFGSYGKFLNPAAQVITAGAIAHFGPKYVGRTMAYAAVGAIGFALLVRYTPLSSWISKAEVALSGPLTVVTGAVTHQQDGSSPAFSQMPAPRRASNLAFA